MKILFKSIFALTLSAIVLSACTQDNAKQTVTPKGHLVIIGGGTITKDIVDRIVILGGGKEARILIVPYANFKKEDSLSIGDRLSENA